MLARVPARQLSLDPLIRDAKRRAQQRRVLIAVGIVLVAGAAAGTVLAAHSSRGLGAASNIAAGPASDRMGLVEAKGPAFPVRTFVLTLTHDRQLTVSDVKVTENGEPVFDPTLIPASHASGDRGLSNEYLLQYKSPSPPDKKIRVQAKVKAGGTVVARYTSPALSQPQAARSTQLSRVR